MTIQRIISLVCMGLMVVCAGAQKVKVKKKTIQETTQKAKFRPTAEQTAMINDMLPATARVTFVDSIVVSKDSFLHVFHLPDVAGKVVKTSSVLNGSLPQGSMAYINEFGNRCVYAGVDSAGNSQLFFSDKKLGSTGWDHQLSAGITPDYLKMNYPFMMNDGTTLIFAAEGANSIGGYDIFVTNYNNETHKYFKPENYGLPFNSTANDYLLAIDEVDSLGWLVTDRRQPAGKVCIYTFIPTAGRVNYTGVPMAQLRRLAEITSIRDTWTDKTSVEKALQRLQSLKVQTAASSTSHFFLPINNKVVYTKYTDFRSALNRQKYSAWQTAGKLLSTKQLQLAALRKQYHEADSRKRAILKNKILQAETEITADQARLKNQLESIVNAENKLINQ